MLCACVYNAYMYVCAGLFRCCSLPVDKYDENCPKKPLADALSSLIVSVSRMPLKQREERRVVLGRIESIINMLPDRVNTTYYSLEDEALLMEPLKR